MKHAHMVGGLLALYAPCILSAQANTLEYRVAVVSESADIATWLKPTPSGLAVDRVVPLGIMPSDIDGPHHVAVAPDATSYYVSIAHGTPFGSLWKLDAHSHVPLGRAQVELFPTTISLTPDGQFAFVANSDFHGDHPRSNVISVVHTPTMTKITDVPACDMPHGVKVNHAGNRAYVTCMHSDEVLEIDVATLAISRRARVGAGHSRAGTACSPTYVSVSRDDTRLYLACNHSNTMQVWDALALRPVKELSVGAGAYNVEPSPDGRTIIVSNKKAQSISRIDARTLTETARIPTSKKLVHGVAYSPDSRLAYVTSESIGIDPGAVDVIDIAARKVVSSISISGQPTGIAVLPIASSTARR